MANGKLRALVWWTFWASEFVRQRNFPNNHIPIGLVLIPSSIKPLYKWRRQRGWQFDKTKNNQTERGESYVIFNLSFVTSPNEHKTQSKQMLLRRGHFLPLVTVTKIGVGGRKSSGRGKGDVSRRHPLLRKFATVTHFTSTPSFPLFNLAKRNLFELYDMFAKVGNGAKWQTLSRPRLEPSRSGVLWWRRRVQLPNKSRRAWHY